MNEKRQIGVNLISSLISFFVSLLINFFISPYIINNVGSAAYGFVSLGNQFVGYIQIITVALNSMAARFVTIRLYEKKEEEARVYFTSVFFSNIILTILITVPLTLFVLFIERILEVPADILWDVKLLWMIIFINFIINLIMNVFSIATYAKNKVYLSSLRTIESNIIKAAILVLLYVLFRPSIVYIGIGALVATIYVVISNFYYTKKLLPEMNITMKYFRLGAIKELASAGVWNSLTRLSSVLISGLDLLIANIFVGADAMGILAVAKTLPSVITSLIGTIPGAFTPQFIKDYAEKKDSKLLKNVNSSIKIISIISCVPLVALVVFGKSFYSLWIPSQNPELVHILSLVSCATIFFTAPINPLYSIYTVTNKVKYDSISIFIQGILSTAFTFILLYYQQDEMMKIFIIAGISTILGIIRALTFTPLYAAHCLKIKLTSFYNVIGRALLAFLVAFVVEFGISFFMKTTTWLSLIIFISIASIAGLICNIFVILNKEERSFLKEKIMLFIRR